MRCANCGAEFTGAFCPDCGQKVVSSDLTMREFLHETTQELTSWEGKIPRTLKALFTKPGLLTTDFLAGRRARWLPPLRLYLICSLAFFASKPLVEAVTHRPARQVTKFSLTGKTQPNALTDDERKAIAEGLPGRIFGVERLERAAKDQVKLNREIDASFPKAMFILLPLFALLTNVAWRRKQRRYPAHLYLALHLHAAWFGAFAIGTLLSALWPTTSGDVTLGFAALAYVVVSSLIALHRVFGDSWPRTLAKAAVVTFVYMLAFGVVSLALLGYAIMAM